MDESLTHWSFSASTTWMVVLGLVWIAVAWLCWANWHRRRGAAAAWMETLRLVVVTMILITLVQPEWVRRIVLQEEPEVVVLYDASGSMDTLDMERDTGESALESRADWVTRAVDSAFWKPLEDQADVTVESFGRAVALTNNPGLPALGDTNTSGIAAHQGTDLNAALESVLERPSPLKAILLLSDGDWNVGRNPMVAASRMRGRNIPLFTVAVGRDRPLPDLVLEPVSTPSYGLLGEQISIPFRIRSYLQREVSTGVTLHGGRGNVVKKDVVIPPFGQVQDSLIWMPQAVGDYELIMTLPQEAEEYLADNNERTMRMTIRTEKIRVLVVDSFPRWEYRYLRNALERDPGVTVHCLLYHPKLGPGDGRDYLPSFPATAEAMASYDVVFLGDVGMEEGELTEDNVKLIRGLVEDQASGLVFLPGSRGRQVTLHGTALEELYPVLLNEERPKGLTSGVESSLRLTLKGKDHFLTRLANNESRNDNVWKGLPGYYWCSAVEKARAGAEVLAVHASQRNAHGRLPLLAIRPFGNGEVLFMGIDSAWRWRRGVEDLYHYRFWGQVVRWMAHKRHMAKGDGLRMAYSPEHPESGQTVFFQVTVLDLAAWNASQKMEAVITHPAGQTEQLELRLRNQGWGVYEGQFLARAGGPHELTVTYGGGSSSLKTTIDVTGRQTEWVGQPARPAVLRELATLTGGRTGRTGDLAGLIEQISLLPEPEPEELRFRLWSNPWWGGAILFLLAIYWTARKAAGMI